MFIHVTSDGGAKCGTLFCAHNTTEKMEAGQEINLYSTVLMVRLEPPQFVVRLVRNNAQIFFFKFSFIAITFFFIK